VGSNPSCLAERERIANGRDPVLAHAVESLGVKITAEEAGKAFP